MANILIIDDDEMLCEMLSFKIESMQHSTKYAQTFEEGLKEALSNPYDVVFLDVRLPNGSGLDALPKIRATPSVPEVIIITGEGSTDGAELAIKSDAWDYIEKPLSAIAISLQLTRVLQYREGIKSGKTAVVLKREGIVGESIQIKKCLELVAKASGSKANVLIAGETGTGKELFARAIHNNSAGSERNLVVVDCGALTETLVESMLFGHEKGAFTGAYKVQEGLIRQADGGTLFLDEVGELPMSTQAAFLRVLQERRFRPIGGSEEIKVDFRLIAATNHDIDQMTQAGKFRQDLLFRLRSITIDLPPLRKRNEDIRALTFYYMIELCDRYGLGIKGFSPEFLDALTAYSWPGNVRELVNAIESAFSEAQDAPILFPMHLPTHIRIQLARASIAEKATDKTIVNRSADRSEPFPNLRTLIEETERQYLSDLVSHADGNIEEACRLSGLSRANIYKRLKKYNISRRF